MTEKEFRTGPELYIHRDNGEGAYQNLVAWWVASVDHRTAVYEAKNVRDLQLLGNVLWTLAIRPDLWPADCCAAIR